MAANQMVEVTALLAAASCQLSVGQLLHGESFSLYEAMSAIEVGNPKMDAGVGAPATTLEQRLQQGAAPTDLSNDQMLAIIDKLMVMEASWHSGNPLAQTIYTCLYVLQPAR